MSKIIHRIWLGPNPMPENYVEFGFKWQELNPDWSVWDWNEATLAHHYPHMNQDVLNHLATPGPGQEIHPVALATQYADVLDYELLYRYGGFYVNTDIEPVRPLQELFDRHPALYESAGAGFEIDEWVVNAAMWAPRPRMPFWARVIEALPDRYFSNPDDYMSNTTGPHLLTQVWRERNDLYVWEKDVFNPIYFPEVEVGKDAVFDFDKLPSVTIGVHHWGHRKNGRPQTSKV